MLKQFWVTKKLSTVKCGVRYGNFCKFEDLNIE